jgi:hypothetical protein
MEIKSFNQNVQTLAKAEDKKTNGPMGQQVSAMAHEKNAVKEAASVTVKREMNAAILQSAADSLSATDEPMALVLKTALEGINEALKETMGDNAIQKTYDSGLDVSPEATAGRIVSLSTAFFGKYQEIHSDLSQEEALSSFTEIISGGIDSGFAEARKVLDGLGVLEGDIASNIDKTYALVQDGLKSFVDNYGNIDEA